MDRRTFLKATGVCAASTAAGTQALARERQPLGFARPSAQNATVILQTVSSFPDNLAGPSDQLHKLATSIKRAAQGRIELDIASTPAQAANAPLIPKGAHASFALLHRSNSAHPASLYMSGMPHAQTLSAAELTTWLNIYGGQSVWDKMFESSNIKPILAGHLGEVSSLWSNVSIQSMQDLTGRKVASCSIPPGLLRAMGATPVDVPPANLAHELKSGTIDVAEAGGFHTAMSLGLHKSASHVARGMLAASGTSLTFAVSLDTWHALSEADRELVQSCADQNFQGALGQNRTLEKPLASALASQHRIKISSLNPQFEKDLQRLADTFVAHVAGHDELSNWVNTSYVSFKNLMA